MLSQLLLSVSGDIWEILLNMLLKIEFLFIYFQVLTDLEICNRYYAILPLFSFFEAVLSHELFHGVWKHAQ